MSKVGVTIANAGEIKRWIGAELKNTEKLSYKVLQKVATKIMSEAKREAPIITGRLKSSIHVEEFGSSQFAYEAEKSGEGFNGSFSESPKEGEILVGTNVVYAWRVEKKRGFFKRAVEAGQFEITRKLNGIATK